MRLLLLCVGLLLGSSVRGQLPFTDSHLPIIRITTTGTIPDEPKVMATLEVVDNGPAALNYPDDPATGYAGYIGIERRGQSSLNWPKRSYGIETRLADGSNNNVPLLDLPAENDWVLHAPYHDRSLLRNVFVYGLGRSLLGWSPRTRYVELLLDGQYRGVYVLAEKIKRDAARVRLDKLDADDTTAPAITGGYLLKIDKGIDSTGVNHFKSTFRPGGTHPEATVDVHFLYPKPGDINAAQRSYITDYFNAFETALAGPDFADPQRGYAAYADVQSFVDYLILSELTGNLDAYRVSTYFHKPRGGKLTMGPLWDYNFALGSTLFCEADDVDRWRYAFNELCTGDRWLVPFWWQRLLEDPAFGRRVRARYTDWRAGPLHLDSLYARLNAQVDRLGAAAARDYARWPGGRSNLPYTTTSHGEEVDELRDWLRRRLDFLDTHWRLTPPPPETSWRAQSGPARGPVTINYQLANAGPVQLRLYDVRGRLMHETETRLEAGLQQYAWAVFPPPGAYYLVWQLPGAAPETQALVRY